MRKKIVMLIVIISAVMLTGCSAAMKKESESILNANKEIYIEAYKQTGYFEDTKETYPIDLIKSVGTINDLDDANSKIEYMTYTYSQLQDTFYRGNISLILKERLVEHINAVENKDEMNEILDEIYSSFSSPSIFEYIESNIYKFNTDGTGLYSKHKADEIMNIYADIESFVMEFDFNEIEEHSNVLAQKLYKLVLCQ